MVSRRVVLQILPGTVLFRWHTARNWRYILLLSCDDHGTSFRIPGHQGMV